MQLELVLDPSDATRLSRLPWLKTLRAGRARSRTLHLVWHDSPDGALAAQGLALTEQRGLWRLERLFPDAELWPPGAPPTVLAEGRSPAGLHDPMPDPLPPVASFEGLSRTLTLSGPLTLTELHGVVRSFAGSRDVCRIVLDGPDPVVQAVALRLTRDIRLEVPRASLAAEATSITRGLKPPARREGAPQLPDGLAIAGAFTYVVSHLTDVILHYAPSAATGEDGPEPVHQMRVATRRLRSALKVFREAVQCEAVTVADAGLKSLADRLGPTRDWDVFVTETGSMITTTFPDDARIQRLLAAAERRRRSCHAELRSFLESAEFRCLGIELACLAGGEAWQATLGDTEQAILATPLDEYAARVLSRRLRRLAKPGDDIDGLEPETLHGIRLHAKRMRYAAEIFAPIYPGKVTQRFIRRLSALQQRLGVLNDGVVAASLLTELVGKSSSHAFAAGMVVGFLGARSANVREKASKAWERFHKVAPFWE
jgi:CHAD domain-containing protein